VHTRHHCMLRLCISAKCCSGREACTRHWLPVCSSCRMAVRHVWQLGQPGPGPLACVPLSPSLFNVFINFLTRPMISECEAAGLHGFKMGYKINDMLVGLWTWASQQRSCNASVSFTPHPSGACLALLIWIWYPMKYCSALAWWDAVDSERAAAAAHTVPWAFGWHAVCQVA
jgi:hypothetical protein